MKILIIKLSAIGDVIHTFPAIDKLKIFFPYSNISYIVNERASILLKNNTNIDTIYTLSNKFPLSLYKDILTLYSLLLIKWDLIIDFHNIFKTFILKLFIRGPVLTFNYNICFLLENKLSYLFSNINPPPSNNISKINNYIELVNFVTNNYENKQEYYFNKINYDETTEIKHFQNLCFKNKIVSYISICFNCSGKSRLWNENKWIKLILLLSKKYKVLIIGSQLSTIGLSIKHKLFNKNVFFLDSYNLITCCYILKKSTLYIGVDSCMLHLANYLGVKSLGLFGPTCAVYNSFHLFKKFNYLQAKTTFIRHKNLKDFDCMNQIKVNDVYSKIMDLC